MNALECVHDKVTPPPRNVIANAKDRQSHFLSDDPIDDATIILPTHSLTHSLLCVILKGIGGGRAQHGCSLENLTSAAFSFR